MTLPQYKNATQHLCDHDPVMASLVQRHGPCTIEPHSDYYRSLASSIIGQQLSVKAAATIRDRFAALAANDFPTPEEVSSYDADTLRGVGLSGAKVRYVKELAEHVTTGRLQLNQLPELSNDEIVVAVTDIKGIGEWTAHMFLIFCLGRLDVLPVGDLGVRKAMQIQYDFAELPTPVQMQAVAERHNWVGYESVASWYLWRSLDNAPVE